MLEGRPESRAREYMPGLDCVPLDWITGLQNYRAQQMFGGALIVNGPVFFISGRPALSIKIEKFKVIL